jgi:PPK2 family polyphosphate:nucleotide phosphotransferase
MFEAIADDYLVPFDGTFDILTAPTMAPRGQANKRVNQKRLREKIAELRELQRVLYASDHHSILLVFQAMDAAGKDGTIRAVMSGVNPAGCQVYSFKKPNPEELDHDFLWRTARRLPERGRIGIFNRSYYEEVLVVRVHPKILGFQKLPDLGKVSRADLFAQRLESIRDHELHLARNGTVVIKFFLNVSRDEQRERFLDRIDDPSKNWKFTMADVEERQHWPRYMRAYQDALNGTSRAHAPWYAIPADDKPYMRYRVASIIVDTLKALPLKYPELDERERAHLAEVRARLVAEDYEDTIAPPLEGQAPAEAAAPPADAPEPEPDEEEAAEEAAAPVEVDPPAQDAPEEEVVEEDEARDEGGEGGEEPEEPEAEESKKKGKKKKGKGKKKKGKKKGKGKKKK